MQTLEQGHNALASSKVKNQSPHNRDKQIRDSTCDSDSHLCYKYDFDLSLWSVSQAIYTDFQAKGKKIKGHNHIQLAKSVNSELKDFVQRGPA